MSDEETTPQEPTPATPLADETEAELAAQTGSADLPIPDAPSLTVSSDPADRTDTTEVQPLPADYTPVSAADHVAPEPALPAVAEDVPQEEPADLPAPVPAAAPPAAAAAPEPQLPVYLQAPVAPRKRGNRGVGILIAVVGAVVFAALDALSTYGILALNYGSTSAEKYLNTYLTGWDFWIPVAVFLAAFIALVAIVNRSGWWAYVLGSIFVAAFVFAGFFAATLVTAQMWNRTYPEFETFARAYFRTDIPYLWIAFATAFIAIEVVVWIGLWIARRGAAVKRRNVQARRDYDEQLAALDAQPVARLG